MPESKFLPSRNGDAPSVALRQPSPALHELFKRFRHSLKISCPPSSNSETMTLPAKETEAPTSCANQYYTQKLFATDQAGIAEYFFTIPKRYADLEFLGIGGQGIVVTALDLVTDKTMVIKKLSMRFEWLDHLHPDEKDSRSAKLLHVVTKDILLLNALRHPNILPLANLFTPNDELRGFSDIYHVTEYRGDTLQTVFRKFNAGHVRLPHELISYMIYQILSGVSHLHRSNVLHKDLKPQNIVLDEEMRVTILDLGWSREVDEGTRLTRQVGAHLYNAPELLYKTEDGYDGEVDVWSIGCIMGELIRLSLTFFGKTIDDVYSNITKVLGSPSDDAFYNRFVPQDRATLVTMRGRQPRITFEEHFADEFFQDGHGTSPLTSSSARALLKGMLQIDAKKRLTVRQCLQHPYVRLWGGEPDCEATPEAGEIAKIYKDDAVNSRWTSTQWKENLFDFLKTYRKEHDVFGPSNGI